LTVSHSDDYLKLITVINSISRCWNYTLCHHSIGKRYTINEVEKWDSPFIALNFVCSFGD